jgi:hypothetical protein
MTHIAVPQYPCNGCNGFDAGGLHVGEINPGRIQIGGAVFKMEIELGIALPGLQAGALPNLSHRRLVRTTAGDDRQPIAGKPVVKTEQTGRLKAHIHRGVSNLKEGDTWTQI